MDFLKKIVRPAQKPALKSSRSLQFESLETRELLAANSLCTLTAYAQTDNPAEIRFTVTTSDAKATSLELKASSGGTLDPSKIELRGSDGKALSFSSATDGTKTTSSTGIISLGPGSYTAYVYADSGTSGNLTFEIKQGASSSPGLVYLIEAAIIQQQDGWAAVRSSYTKLLDPYFGWGSYENLNSTKKSMLDLNGDGKITTGDADLARVSAANPNSATISSTSVVAQDLTPPTIGLALKNGSTTSTTDPTLSGKISDANGIKAGSSQYSLDNGVSWASLTLDANGNYTIPASAFKSVGTYSVVVRATDTKGNLGSASLSVVYAGTTITNPTVNDNGTGKASVGSGLQVQTVNGTTFPANNRIVIPGKGTVVKNADGTLSFVVDPAFYQSIPKNKTEIVSVQVVSKDSVGNVYTTPVEFKLVGVNDLPTRNGAAQEKITLNKGTNGSVTHATLLSNWSDPDTGTVLTISAASIDSVTCSNADIKTYTAAYLASCFANQGGKMTFTATESLLKELGKDDTLTVKVAYTVSDGDGGNVVGYLTFVINGLNDKPTAADFTVQPTAFPYAISQAEILSKGNVQDVNANDKGKLTVSAVVVQSGTGSISYVNGTLTFTPDAAKLAETPIGQELVTVLAYTVADAHGGTTNATITLKYNGTKKVYTANIPSITQIKFNGTVVYSGSGTTFAYGGKTVNVPSVVGNGQLLNDSYQFVQKPSLSDTSFIPEGVVAEFTVQYDVLLNGTATGTKGTTAISVTGVNVKPTVVANGKTPGVDEKIKETSSQTAIDLAKYLTITDPNAGDVHTIKSIVGKNGTVSYTGGILTVELASGATVSYSGNGLNITYDPNGKFDSLSEGVFGLDALTLTITDNKTNGESAPVSLNVRIVGEHTPITLESGRTSTTTVPPIGTTTLASSGGAVGTLSVLRDADDKLDYRIVGVQHPKGTVPDGLFQIGSDGVLRVNPSMIDSLNMNGAYTVTVVVENADFPQDDDLTLTYILSFTHRNAPKASSGNSFSIFETETKNFDLAANDKGGDGKSVKSNTGYEYSITGCSNASLVAGVDYTISKTGLFSIIPNGKLDSLADGETLVLTFDYLIVDTTQGDGSCRANGILTVTVLGKNTKPTLNSISATVRAGETSAIDWKSAANDVDHNDSLRVTEIGGFAIVPGGSVTISGVGRFDYGTDDKLTFTPDAIFNKNRDGVKSVLAALDLTVADKLGATASATLNLSVLGVNQRPVVKELSLSTPIDVKLAIRVEDIVSDANLGDGHEFVSITIQDVSGTKTLDVSNRKIVLDSGTTIELSGDLRTLTIDGETRKSILDPWTSADLGGMSERLTLSIVVRDDSRAANAVSVAGNIVVQIRGIDYRSPKVAKPDTLRLGEDDTTVSTFTLSNYISDRNVPERKTTDWYTITGISAHAAGIGPHDVSAFWGFANGILTLNGPSGIFDFLKEGETAILEFTYTVEDVLSGCTAEGTIRVEILGKNDPPTFGNNVPSFTVTEGISQPNKEISFDELLTEWTDRDHSRSELNISNVRLDSAPSDSLITLSDIQNAVGLFNTTSGRTVSFNTSHEIFRKLGKDQSVELTFTYTTFDPDGGFGTGSFKIVVNGRNDAPTFSAQKTSFELRNNSKAQTVSFDPLYWKIADVDLNDAGQLTYGLDVVSTAKGFSINPTTGMISIDNADFTRLSGDIVITVTLNDTHGGSTPLDLTIRVSTEPNPIVADKTLSVGEDDVAKTRDLTKAITKTLGHAYSVDTTPVLKSGTLPSGVEVDDIVSIDANGVFTFTPGNSFQYLSKGETLELVFEFTVSDDGFANCETTATITVTVVGENDAPEIVCPNGKTSFAVTNSGKAPGESIDLGTFLASDIDLKDSHTWAISNIAYSSGKNLGSLPSIQIDATTGQVTLANTNLSLNPGESATFTFLVNVFDGTVYAEKEISVTVCAKQVPTVTLTPNDPTDFVFKETDFDDDFMTEWNIGVADPTESFTSWTQRTGNDWFSVGTPSFTMKLNGTTYSNSNLDSTSLGYKISGNALDGYKLVFQPTAGLFDFLNADDVLTLQIKFTVHDTEYGVDKVFTQDITIRGEASQHSISGIAKDVFSIWTNKRVKDSFRFDPGFTMSDVDRGAKYDYSISNIVVESKPDNLSEEKIRSYFSIDATTGVVTLLDTATGNFVCKITVSVSKAGADDVRQDLTITVQTAGIPSATTITGSITEDSSGLTATPTFTSPSGQYTLDGFVLPTRLVISYLGRSDRYVDWTDAMSACVTFDTTTGEFRFTPNHVFDFLAEGETATAELTYIISDAEYAVSATGVVQLNILGKNTAPVVKQGTVIDRNPLHANSTEGSVYYLDKLASDADFGDELEFYSITVGGNVHAFNGANSIVVAGYGTFIRESDATGKFLRFVPDRTGRFSTLIADDEEADGYKQTEKFDLGYTVVDKAGLSASGTIDITMEGVNHLPKATSETSNVSESLTAEEHVLSIDLGRHFSDADLAGLDDSLTFSISSSSDATNTFIKKMEIVDGKLLITYISRGDFNWSTNTKPIKITVTAKDRYTGICSKDFTFSMNDAQTVGLSIIAVTSPSNGTKPQGGQTTSTTGGSYYIEVWASDLFKNGSAENYSINFGLNTATTDSSTAHFTLSVDYGIGEVTLKSNGVQLDASGIASISAGGDVLLLRIMVLPDATLESDQTVKFSLKAIDITRSGIKVAPSQIRSAAIEFTHHATTPTQQVRSYGQSVSYSAWAPTSWSVDTPTAWDVYEYSLFVDKRSSSDLQTDTPTDAELSLGTGFSAGIAAESLFASDFDPFAPLEPSDDPLDHRYAEDYEQSLAEHLLGVA